MALQRLLRGFAAFHREYYADGQELFSRLVTQGQSPKVLVIGCSDARVDPAILTRVEPGDLFVVRNVAALVPPRETDSTHHGTSAAIEFAVRSLKVEHVVVLGHALCGGVGALIDDSESPLAGYDFLLDWVRLATPVRDQVKAALAGEQGVKLRRAVEQGAVLNSLHNLTTFPWLAERVVAGQLSLHGWYFDLTVGELSTYTPQARRFVTMTDPEAAVPAVPDGKGGTPGQAAARAVHDFVAALSADGGGCAACAAGVPHDHGHDHGQGHAHAPAGGAAKKG